MKMCGLEVKKRERSAITDKAFSSLPWSISRRVMAVPICYLMSKEKFKFSTITVAFKVYFSITQCRYKCKCGAFDWRTETVQI